MVWKQLLDADIVVKSVELTEHAQNHDHVGEIPVFTAHGRARSQVKSSMLGFGPLTHLFRQFNQWPRFVLGKRHETVMLDHASDAAADAAVSDRPTPPPRQNS